jgi:hypothetical protein
MKAKFGFFAALLALVCPPPLCAEQIRDFTAQFTVFSYNRIFGLYYQPEPESELMPLEFLNSARSIDYAYEGFQEILFYELDPNFEKDPESEPSPLDGYRAVARVNLPESEQELLFIFFPVERNGRRSFLVFALNDSPAQFPYGSLRFFNATTFNLGGRIGSRRVDRIAPGDSPIFPMSSRTSAIILAQTASGQFHFAFEGDIEGGSDERVLVIFFPPVLRGSIELQYRFLREDRDDRR